MVEKAQYFPSQETETSAAPEVFTAMDFIKDWRNEAKNAQNRVWLACMDFEFGHAPGLVQSTLVEAAKRGLDTRVTMDAFSKATVNDEIKWLGQLPINTDKVMQNSIVKELDENFLENLEAAGAKLTITNPKLKPLFKGVKFGPELPADIFPFFNRNHMKMFIIDDTAWFGGVNVATDHFEKADFLVKFKDSQIVKAIEDLYGQVNENRPERDYVRMINDNYSLLVDRGDPGKSLILDTATNMIDRASESVEFLSQLPPDGKHLEKLIKKAREGVKINIVLSTEREYTKGGFPFGMLQKRAFNAFKKKIEGISNISVFHYPGGKVHGKVQIIDSREAIFGSHNLVTSGVSAGTQEASMWTKDASLVPQLQDVIDSIKDGSFDRGLRPEILDSRRSPSYSI